MASRQASLLPDVRACCCCRREARTRRGMMPRGSNEPEIVTITPYLYVSGTSTARRKLKNAPKVNICTDCLGLAFGGTSSNLTREALDFFAALRNSVTYGYEQITNGR